MTKLFVIVALVLGGCSHGAKKAVEFETKIEVVEKLVPIKVPCDEVAKRPNDPMENDAATLEEKVNRLVLSDYTLRKYVFSLELALVSCGGKVENEYRPQ